MAKDLRNSSYKRLQARVLDNRKRSYALDDVVSKVAQSLFPDRQIDSQSGSNAAADNTSLQKAFDSKLSAMAKENAARLNEVKRSSEEETSAIRKQAAEESKRTSGISKNLQKAIKRIYEERQQAAQSTTPVENSSEIQEDTTPSLSYTAPTTTPLEKEPIDTEGIVTIGEKAVKAALKIGQEVSLGDNYYRVTNLFGPRVGENAVAGRGPGHSRGVDVVGHSGADKAKTNAPISVTDGVIESISLEGSGKDIKTTEGTAGGYVMNVRMPNGKMIRYMHLSPDIANVRKELIGKPVKRGDVLFQGDHSKYSGSGTGSHVKISVSSVGEDGSMLRDHDNPENDPTPYILYGNQQN